MPDIRIQCCNPTCTKASVTSDTTEKTIQLAQAQGFKLIKNKWYCADHAKHPPTMQEQNTATQHSADVGLQA